MIAPSEGFSVDELRAFFARSAGIPFAHSLHRARSEGETYWLDELTAELDKPSTLSVAVRDSKGIEGIAVCAESPWDTEIVGRQVGILKYVAVADDLEDQDSWDCLIGETLKRAKDRGIDCLICKLQPLQFAAIHAVERHGFLLMDTLLDFVCDFSRTPIENIRPPRRGENLATRLSRPEDQPAVLALSEKAFANFLGRYNVDARMAPGTGAKVYRSWVQSAFRGWADMILIAEVKDTVVGFGIWRKPSKLESKHLLPLAHYSLAGVHPDYSGQGIYSALAFDGMKKVQTFAEYIDGPVHVTNHAVHRALQRLGWKIAGARHTFHKWISK